MADAAWILDISAALDGQSQQTLAELDALTESLVGAGKRADEFQAAMKLVATQLDAAKVAATAANAALAQGQDQYQQLERDAIRASKALEKASAQGPELEASAARARAAADEYRAMLAAVGSASDEQTEKLLALDRTAARAAKAVERNAAVQPRLAEEARRTDAALKAYVVDLGKLESDSADATAAQKKLEQQLKNVDKVAKHVDDRNARAAQRYAKVAEASALLPGPLGRYLGTAARAGKANQELTATFGAATTQSLLMASATVGVAVAIAVVTAAMVAGAIAAAGYAIGQADAAREAGLAREAFAALSGEAAAGVAAFDAVSAATGLSDKDLVSLTKSLRAAEVSARDMPIALRAAALAEAALGAGGAAEFVRQIQEGEKSVTSFAAEAEAKFGGVVAAKLRGLTAQSERASKLWGKMFDRLNLDPVLDALDVLVGMLDRGNPTAQAFSDALGGAFKLVETYALPAAYAVEAFVLGFEIQMVKLYLAIKPALGWLSDLFGFDDDTLRTTLDIAGVAGKMFAGVFIVGVGAAVAVMGAFAAVIATVFGPLTLLAVAIGYVVKGTVDLVSSVAALIPQMVELGGNLLMGLVEGVTGAVGYVVQAVTGAVTSAIDAAKDVLGIHSPSKVFAEIGDNTAQGYVQGVEAGTPEAQDSLARMASPADAAASAPAEAAQGGTAASSGRGTSFDFQGATFVFHGVADAETARDRFAEMLTTLLEGDADSLSGMVEAPV